MDYSRRWQIIEELGQGGQGKVYRVLDISKFNIDKQLRPDIEHSIQAFASIQTEESRKALFERFRKAIVDIIRMEDPNNHGALKVLHKPTEARDSERAEERIKREIQAMSKAVHPNLLKILDSDPESKWFVSQYYPKGTLVENRDKFTGEFAKTLKAFRPLVEGVSELHKEKMVHRDIKPQNVFLDSNDNLILGDFGLILFSNSTHTRISGKFENVGTHAWMPAWATDMLIEEVKPSFDVYSLGKLFWAMVSGLHVLRLWYFDKPEFNLEQRFPNKPFMRLANHIFKKCIVEEEKDCLPDASALLSEVDQTLFIIENNADVFDPNIKQRCKVCGIGNYELIVEKGDRGNLEAFGLHPNAGAPFKVFCCDHCGYVQLFDVTGPRGQTLPVWGKNK